MSLGRKIYYTLNSGKNPKFVYYIKNAVRQAWPKAWLNVDKELAKLDSRPDRDYILQRVDYYCQLTKDTPYDRKAWEEQAIEIGKQPMTSQSVYYYDALEFSRWFDQKKRWIPLFLRWTYCRRLCNLIGNSPNLSQPFGIMWISD